MAEFPALPLFTDAYLADTRHLNTEEHGAYLLLMMEAWRRPECSLPDDDRLLARLAGLPLDRWQEVRPVVMQFWRRDGRRKTWTQKRLVKERAFVSKKSASQADKAATRWKKTKKTDAAALPNECPADAPTPTPTPTVDIGGGGGTRGAETTLRERILAACGADPVSGLIGPGGRQIGTRADMEEVARWAAMPGIGEAEILSVVTEMMAGKRDGPPSTLRYFRPGIERLAAAIAAPPLDPSKTPPARGVQPHGRNREPGFAAKHREYVRRVAAGEIDPGPDPSDPDSWR
ncbi:DUF1376 domain-containing protein [Cereibacter sphaeroides f. sp. denitrificans]|nr:DUF1376 domain-containing protein [Cereibacter sphaeroides f. sp. denitrificans]